MRAWFSLRCVRKRSEECVRHQQSAILLQAPGTGPMHCSRREGRSPHCGEPGGKRQVSHVSNTSNPPVKRYVQTERHLPEPETPSIASTAQSCPASRKRQGTAMSLCSRGAHMHKINCSGAHRVFAGVRPKHGMNHPNKVMQRGLQVPAPSGQMQFMTASPAAAAAEGVRASTSVTSSSSSSPSTSGSSSVQALKQELRQALDGTDRGIFGLQAARRSSIAALIEQLEGHNPLQAPTQHPDQVQGSWRLLYTTITITGAKKTKLGLREFVKLGEFVQSIDTSKQLAVNLVRFAVAGLGTLSGSLTITASYAPESDQRVAITFNSALLEPAALEKLFKQNYDLLLSIFNPEGWLDITYVDDELRVGRDDKGNIFLLERM